MASKPWRVFVGGALLAGLVATGCSSSGSSGASSPASTAAPAADLALLGPQKPATGTPLKIGYIYAGQAENIDNTNEIKIAQATVKYLNEHLAGIAGRPVELVTCADHLTPAGSTDCANQMLAAKVSAVLAGQPASGGSIVKVLEPAKVPFFISTGADASVVSSDVTVLANPVIAVAGPIKIAKDAGVKKVAVLLVDVPAAAQAKVIGDPLFKKAGIDASWTSIPLGTPDVTPQVQAAISGGAEQFVVIGDDSLCVNSLKAIKTLAFTGKVASNMNCLADPSASAIPGGFNNLIVPTTRVLDDSEPDYRLLQAIAAKYAPGTPTTDEGQASFGFVTVMGLARAMKNLKAADATPAGIAAAFRSMPPEPQPLLSSRTFQCNRTAYPLLPSVCSNSGALQTVDSSGRVTNTEPFDATPYL
jgi:branched-chain amino acid transport system substrate-binding protein